MPRASNAENATDQTTAGKGQQRPAKKTTAPKKPRSEKKAHQNLSSWDTIRLWVAAGGRCQRCNKLVGESETSFESLNLAQRAHIVGQIEGGPRGDATLSAELARELNNVMLLCLACHKEIDDDKQQHRFPVEALRRMKQKHEERIRYLTSLEPKRTRVLLFTTPIRQPADAGQDAHHQEVSLRKQDAYEAVLPDFFADSVDPVRIRVEVDTEEDAAHWQATFGTIKQRYEAKVAGEGIEHLSVFGLGKIPALAYLGRLIGDTRTVEVFNVNNGAPQKWQEHAPQEFKYRIIPPEQPDGANKQLLLLLSLSGKVERDQYVGVVPEDAQIYEIANESQYRQLNWLVAKSQLKQFREAYRQVLAQVQEAHGQTAIIHVLAAVPPAVAIEVGRMHRPNSHPQIEIYNCIGRRFSPALTLGRIA
ncbi:SAVED domain-containing protein [Deinococcus petrolearius]|uniref:SAVED domain-containing protein n=1 Tax=Deinococcus petrolearius TaxID=1751295 RepID=A0ABW1DKQ3_9DEIO